MQISNIKTPGVYINEENAFPNSVVPIATAVPAFIGYTPAAVYNNKSCHMVPTKITSFAEFQAIFMKPGTSQYEPLYYLVEQKQKPNSGDYLHINNKYFSVLPDPSSIYYFYNSIRLFYQNGGSDAYIVSVGTYDDGNISGKPMDGLDKPIVNPNVELKALQDGLKVLQNEQEPTMYICPDATLLTLDDNATLMKQMLSQAEEMQTALCIFDVIGGDKPDSKEYTKDIKTFRENTGAQSLNYGTAYYPFVGTSIVQSNELNYTNLFGGDLKQLKAILALDTAATEAIDAIFKLIEAAGDKIEPTQISQYNASLLNASKLYALIMKHVVTDANLLPPSAGMAGVYTVNDNNRGVWNAPANTSMTGVVGLPIRLNDKQQENLNVDAISGKSINAIRFFNGLGILIWGARTLDGNSQDWRYIQVRRTMTFLEQSIKLAARAYVFEPNTANTWSAIRSSISGFLTNIWKEGGLQGTKPEDAFQVSCGLGSTMTAQDILDGFLKITVLVACVRPAEFIVITFKQEMAKS